jgi:CheY-like chemotaxis protein
VEPFFSTKGVGKGTGLGLSMVHGLASQLNGALTIQSSPGLGTHVELWLPRSIAPQAGVMPAAETMDRQSVQGIVLLVDDEELVRATTSYMLADLGYHVIEAASGEEALSLVEAGQTLDVLVTDHLMPGITGTELARLVKSMRPGIGILLISGYAEREGLDPDIPRLNKPFRKDELAASLSHHGSR